MGRILVVAECGVNWNGDISIAKKMIREAKNSGADAVKFQLFNEETIRNSPYRDILMGMILREEDAMELKNFADNVGIEWFATAMYPDAVDMLVRIGVKRIKIREMDSKNEPLLRKAEATGLEVLVSSQSPPDKERYGSSVKWLYCVPRYPPRLEEIELHLIRKHGFYGYSNHYPDPTVPLAAAALGAKLLEIHVTLDRDYDNLDKHVSIDFQQLRELVRMVRVLERLGIDG